MNLSKTGRRRGDKCLTHMTGSIQNLRIRSLPVVNVEALRSNIVNGSQAMERTKIYIINVLLAKEIGGWKEVTHDD